MKTYEEILKEEEQLQKEWEKNNFVKINGQDFSISQLRETFERVQDENDWKNKWMAFVPYEIIPLVIKAVEYFHGSTPKVYMNVKSDGLVLMSGDGYKG